MRGRSRWARTNGQAPSPGLLRNPTSPPAQRGEDITSGKFSAHTFARTPPVNGWGTPVVPGNVSGRPRKLRTAE